LRPDAVRAEAGADARRVDILAPNPDLADTAVQDRPVPDLKRPPDLGPRPEDRAAVPDLLLPDLTAPDLPLPPDLSPVPDLKAAPDTSPVPDLKPPPDLTPAPDLKPPSNTIVVTSDKLVATPGVLVGHHARWGKDHIIVGTANFARVSSTGKLVTQVALPKKKPATKGSINVVAMAAGSKGLAVVYSDESKLRLALVSPLGKFPAKSEILGSKYNIGDTGVFSLGKGFVTYFHRSSSTSWVEQVQADASALVLGSNVKVPGKSCNFFGPWPGGKVGCFIHPVYGLQQGIITPHATKPALSLGAKLSGPLTQISSSCNRLLWATNGTVTWVGTGAGEVITGNRYLVYNAAKGGKALLPKMKLLTSKTSDFKCWGDVATDGKRFMALWAEALPAKPSNLKWRGQVFGLDGKPLAAAQDLTLKPSTYYTVPADLVARARLHWDGQDFVLFYMHRWPSSESLRMARLVITK